MKTDTRTGAAEDAEFVLDAERGASSTVLSIIWGHGHVFVGGVRAATSAVSSAEASAVSSAEPSERSEAKVRAAAGASVVSDGT